MDYPPPSPLILILLINHSVPIPIIIVPRDHLIILLFAVIFFVALLLRGHWLPLLPPPHLHPFMHAPLTSIPFCCCCWWEIFSTAVVFSGSRTIVTSVIGYSVSVYNFQFISLFLLLSSILSPYHVNPSVFSIILMTPFLLLSVPHSFCSCSK